MVADVGHSSTRGGEVVWGRRIGNILCCSLIEV